MTVACPNINTRFYKVLKYKLANADEIAQVYLKTESDEFKEWYGTGKRDSFNYPEIVKELYFFNEKGESVTLFDLLNDKFFEQKQGKLKNLTYIDKVKNFLEDNKIAIAKRISAFRDTKYAEELDKFLIEIDKLDQNNYAEALALHTDYITRTLLSFENRLYDYDNVDLKKMSAEDKEKRKNKHNNFLLQASSFLETFDKVKLLENPLVESSELSPLIKTLRDTENRVTDLQNRINAEREASIRNTFEPLITNPQVRNGVMDFLAAQMDESGTQLLMDAMADSHHPLLASIAKLYQRNMFEKEEEALEKKREWRDFVKKHGKDFTKYLEKLDGKDTGRFIPKYDPDFQEQLFEHINKIKEIENNGLRGTPEYYSAISDYFKWKRENTELEYVDEYYESLDILTPEARAARQEIVDKKQLILSKGVAKITNDDFDQIRAYDEELKWLRSSLNKDGSKKTGKDLEIAESLFKYTQEVSKFFETTGVFGRAFEKALADAKEEGPEAEKKFLENNTKEEFSKAFWDKFQQIIEQLPKSTELEALREQVKKILIPYKDTNGLVDAEKIPDNVKEQVKVIQEQMDKIRATMSNPEFADLYKELKQLVKFIPNKYYYIALNEKKQQLDKKEITKEEFQKWYDDNHKVNPYTEELEPISIWTTLYPRNIKYVTVEPNHYWKSTGIKAEYNNPNHKKDENGFAVPKDKWLSKEYKGLSGEDQNNLEYIKTLLTDLVEHSKNNIIRKGYLPAIPKIKIKGVKEEKDVQAAVTESGEIVKFVPFQYIKRLNQEELPKINDDMTPEEKEETEKKRQEIIKANKLSHGEVVNTDLAETMEHFIDAALTNKYKSRMEVDLKLAQAQLRHMEIKVKTPAGSTVYDKIKGRIKGTNTEHEISAEGSNLEKRLRAWMDMVFYDEAELDEGKLTKITNNIRDFSSLRALGLNVLSGANNFIVGNINVALEAAGRQYFTGKDWRTANKVYMMNSLNFIANHSKKDSSSYADAFVKKMDILQSQDELSLKPEGLIKTALHKAKMFKNAAYFMQHVGEHQIQNSLLLAVSMSHRIIDGKIVSFQQYWENSKFPVNESQTREENLRNINLNKELKIAKEVEFENHPTVYDSFELKNGYAELKSGVKVSSEELSDFKNRVIGINQKLHGIYNREDAGTIQRYALGRLATQFRRWMRPNWNRRFGARFGKSNWNERRQEYDEGMYISTFKFIANPLIKGVKEYRENQEATAMQAAKVILKGYKEFVFNAKINWHTMSETEKANVRRTAFEMLFLAAVIALGFTFKNLKGADDDDDDLKGKMLTFALYESDRLFGELTTFTPVGIIRESNRLFKAPSPVFNTLEDIGKLLAALILYPVRDDDERKFKSGIYHGQDKVSVYFGDMIPFYNQLLRIMNLSENNQRYGMFK